MSLLAPLFLFGAAAIGLPLLFHLIRRTTRDRTQFSSLRFLRPSPPRLTRRSRLEHLLLLLLRCTVIGLLAFAFARPFLKGKPELTPVSGETRVLILVDTSASMRRGELWEQAMARAEAALRRLSPGDHAAIYTFDREVRPVFTFDEWEAAAPGERSELALRKLAGVGPGWGSTQLGPALTTAAGLVAEGRDEGLAQRKIVLITDAQEGSRLQSLQGHEWPKNLEVTVEPVRARAASNASIQLATEAPGTGPAGQRDKTRVRVANAVSSKVEQFRLGWVDAAGRNLMAPVAEVYVPAGQSRVVALAAPATAADRIRLEGDGEPFDNLAFAIPPRPAEWSILYLSKDREGNRTQPLFFLKRALQSTSRQVVRLTAPPPDTMLQAVFTNPPPALTVVADALPEATVDELRAELEKGATALVLLRGEAMEPTLQRLLSRPELTFEDSRAADYAMLADIDFSHPVFAPFADPRFSDFTRIHFWKYRSISTNALAGGRVLASFDNSAPALLEFPVGRGRAFVLASGWQPEDSQLALSTKFVPFLYSLIEESGAPPSPPIQYLVGDSVPLKSTVRDLIGPSGARIPRESGSTHFAGALEPGVYQAIEPGVTSVFAVNLDPLESKLEPLGVEELERMGVPTSPPAVSVEEKARRALLLKNAEVEARQKFWRWVVLAALVVLLVETWMAGRAARRLVPAGGVAV